MPSRSLAPPPAQSPLRRAAAGPLSPRQVPAAAGGSPAQARALRAALRADAWRRFPALQAAASRGESLEQSLLNAFVAGYALLRVRPQMPAKALESGDEATEAALSEGVFDLIVWRVRVAAEAGDARAASAGLARRLLDAYRSHFAAAILEGQPLAALERRARADIAAALAG